MRGFYSNLAPIYVFLYISVPTRLGGINYPEQTSLFTETNQAMIALLRETQQEN